MNRLLGRMVVLALAVTPYVGTPNSEPPPPPVHQVVLEGKSYRMRIVGHRGSGPGELELPVAVDVDPKGQFYVADAGNARVRVFDPQGRVQATLGVGHLQPPKGLAVAADGTVYVTDVFLDRGLAISSDGRLVRQWGETG